MFKKSISLEVSQKIGRARKRKRNYCATIMSFPWSVLQLLTIALGQIAQLLEICLLITLSQPHHLQKTICSNNCDLYSGFARTLKVLDSS